MMSISEIDKTAIMILDQLPKQNIIGGTYGEICDGFKSMSESERVSYTISLCEIYAKHLEREFKIRSVLGILELGGSEGAEIAKDIRAGKDGAFKRAGEFLAKNNIKDKVVSKRNQKIEDILSMEKIDE